MPLWRLIPTAHETDPRWQGRAIFSEVVVRAETAGLARRAAACFELPTDPENNLAAVGNGAEPLTAGLEDEKLYRLEPIAPDHEQAFLEAHRSTLAESEPEIGILYATRAGQALF